MHQADKLCKRGTVAQLRPNGDTAVFPKPAVHQNHQGVCKKTDFCPSLHILGVRKEGRTPEFVFLNASQEGLRESTTNLFALHHFQSLPIFAIKIFLKFPS